MGNYLAHPNTTKHSYDGSTGFITYSVCGMQGWRVQMEDAHLAHTYLTHPSSETIHLFAVFDGHGGAHVARFTARHMINELLKSPGYSDGRFDVAFRSAYQNIDKRLGEDRNQSELDALRYSSPEAFNEELRCQSDTRRRALSDVSASDVPGQSCGKRGAWSPPIKPRPSYTINSALSSRNDFSQSPSTSPPGNQPSSPSSRPSPLLLSSSSPPSSPKSGNGGAGAQVGEITLPPGSCGPENELNGTPNGKTSSGTKKKEKVSPFSFKAIKEGFSSILTGGRWGGILKNPPPTRNAATLAGCTAVCALLMEYRVIVANAGDSRCVVSRAGKAIPLSVDHKPTMKEEKDRIYKAGGYLVAGRVNGNLNLSRAIGDLLYKDNTERRPSEQIVVSTPDVMTFDMTDEDEFIIIGCDGIWETMSSQDVVTYVSNKIAETPLATIIANLFDDLISPSPEQSECGCDNMTAIIIDLKPQKRRAFSDANTRSFVDGAHSRAASPSPSVTSFTTALGEDPYPKMEEGSEFDVTGLSESDGEADRGTSNKPIATVKRQGRPTGTQEGHRASSPPRHVPGSPGDIALSGPVSPVSQHQSSPTTIPSVSRVTAESLYLDAKQW
eukprot:GHVN01094404.1.p1 GENE.GHVN01094404.1~~GHVN01094404.1.p1  ORF type:complete len:612 (-),score=109.49 GHVN01094404.1:1415-3250(-)